MARTRQRPSDRDPVVVAELKRKLVTVTRRRARADEAARAAAAEQARVIREAHADGVTPTEIAEITWLSPARIAQLRKPT